MINIRPYKLFTVVEGSAMERIASVPLPMRRGTGSVSLLETFLIVAALRAVGAKTVFEFGTYLGGTTLNIALNTPADGQIFTLDLDEQSAASLDQHPADSPLTTTHIASVQTLDFLNTPVAGKVKQLRGNSLHFDSSPWANSIHAVFIDGGHDLETLIADTENSFKMVVRDKRSCILWHDYGNKEYEPLTNYLNQQSATKELYHIEDTMLCAWFNDPSGRIGAWLQKQDAP